jgi:hypothetical protein
MDAKLNKTVTKLVVAALDQAQVSDEIWRLQFRISADRLAQFRVARASLTDAELSRISRATGEPWQNLVLGLLGSGSELTADTRELLSSLHSLSRTAEAESARSPKGQKHFGALRQLMRKRSA